jgi:hypothetical protein
MEINVCPGARGHVLTAWHLQRRADHDVIGIGQAICGLEGGHRRPVLHRDGGQRLPGSDNHVDGVPIHSRGGHRATGELQHRPNDDVIGIGQAVGGLEGSHRRPVLGGDGRQGLSRADNDLGGRS